MDKWKCSICGWIYDPVVGDRQYDLEPGMPFEELPDDFRCPKCQAMKKWFNRVE